MDGKRDLNGMNVFVDEGEVMYLRNGDELHEDELLEDELHEDELHEDELHDAERRTRVHEMSPCGEDANNDLEIWVTRFLD